MNSTNYKICIIGPTPLGSLILRYILDTGAHPLHLSIMDLNIWKFEINHHTLYIYDMSYDMVQSIFYKDQLNDGNVYIIRKVDNNFDTDLIKLEIRLRWISNSRIYECLTDDHDTIRGACITIFTK